MRRKLVIAVVVLAAVDQLVQYGPLSDGELFGRPVAPFDPPLFVAGQRESLERVRAVVAGDLVRHADAPFVPFDAELGWCPRPDSGAEPYRYDWAGCRIGGRELPRSKAPDVTRIVAVGCSFTHGDEVGATESWAARVDEVDGLEVANLGFGAYGLDQALMRLERDGWPLEPDEVWLGLLPPAAWRVTTLYRPAQRHWSSFVGFKPRFVLAGDSLRRVPNPARELADVARLIEDQAAFVAAVSEHDRWVRRAPWAYAERGSHWTHHVALARLLSTLHERASRAPAGAFEPGSETVRLLRAIVLEARRRSEEHGAHFRLVVLPARTDLEDRRSSGRAYWAAFTEELRGQGVEVVDVTGALDDAWRPGAPELWTAGSHYTAEGNRVVADALVARVRR